MVTVPLISLKKMQFIGAITAATSAAPIKKTLAVIEHILNHWCRITTAAYFQEFETWGSHDHQLL